jgi:rod shape-determining protein MreB
VKCSIGSAFPDGDDTRVEVGGSDAQSGLPKTAVLTAEEIRGVIDGHVSKMIDAVKETLGSTPPELSSDIIERGAVLAGGAALLKGLEERLRQETQMPAQVAELPLTCAAAGSGAWLEELFDGKFQEVNDSWH